MKCQTCPSEATVHINVIGAHLCEPCLLKIDNRAMETALDQGQSRTQFEQWVSAPPYEHETLRYPNDPVNYAWPGQYKDITVELAWEAWKEAKRTLTP